MGAQNAAAGAAGKAQAWSSVKNKLRWLLFGCSAACALKSIFGRTTRLSVAGFFFCGLAWYYLTWRRTRELDAPKPR